MKLREATPKEVEQIFVDATSQATEQFIQDCIEIRSVIPCHVALDT